MNYTTAINKDIRTISTTDLEAKLIRHERFAFWNVLTAEYYSNENIVGSRHVPLDRIGREIAETGLAKDTEIVVYCAGPECPQSRAAAEKLRAFGYTNVKVYKGGLEEWDAAGLPIVSDENSPENVFATAETAKISCH